jgi:hypothetical protein
MFVQLEYPPHIGLVIFLVLGVDSIKFAGRAGGSKQGGVEEGSESLKGSR